MINNGGDSVTDECCNQLRELEIQVATIATQLKMCENMLRAAVLMVGAILGLDVSVYM